MHVLRKFNSWHSRNYNLKSERYAFIVKCMCYVQAVEC